MTKVDPYEHGMHDPTYVFPSLGPAPPMDYDWKKAEHTRWKPTPRPKPKARIAVGEIDPDYFRYHIGGMPIIVQDDNFP